MFNFNDKIVCALTYILLFMYHLIALMHILTAPVCHNLWPLVCATFVLFSSKHLLNIYNVQRTYEHYHFTLT